MSEKSLGTRIHDRVRDSLAKQLRRMGATVDLERVAPQWSKKYKDNEGNDEYRFARIDVVATILGLMSCSGSTSQSGGQRQQRMLREAQKTEDSQRFQGEEEKTRKYGNRDEVGPNTAKPVSFELGGRMGTQTIALL